MTQPTITAKIPHAPPPKPKPKPQDYTLPPVDRVAFEAMRAKSLNAFHRKQSQSRNHEP